MGRGYAFRLQSPCRYLKSRPCTSIAPLVEDQEHSPSLMNIPSKQDVLSKAISPSKNKLASGVSGTL